MKILLMGHPNVGKSAVFNRLTGANITESNYPGTTVDYTVGYTFIEGQEYEIIDVPGTFSTEPKDEAEQVALDILADNEDATVISVLDATKVERGLYLSLEIMEKGFPVVLALNMWDDAEKRNIHIDLTHLREILKVPVIPTVAISGKGISELARGVTRAEEVDVEELKRRVESL